MLWACVMNTVCYVNYDNTFYIKFQNAWEHTSNWHQELLPPYQRDTTKTVNLLDFKRICALWFLWWVKRRFCSSWIVWSDCGAVFQMDTLEAGASMRLFRLWCLFLPQMWVSLPHPALIPCGRWSSHPTFDFATPYIWLLAPQRI